MNRTIRFDHFEMRREKGGALYTPRKTIWLPQETRKGSIVLISQKRSDFLEGRIIRRDY